MTRLARTVAIVSTLALLGSLSLAHGHASPIKSAHIPFDSRKVVSDVRAQQQSTDNLSNAFLVDSGYNAVPDTATQTQPAVAFDGTNYLVVWTTSSGIWGTRVDSAGNVMEPLGFAICAEANPEQPAVAFGTSCYLVTWRSGTYRAVRVRRDGRVLDPDAIVIPAWDAYSVPSVAFGGGSFKVVWSIMGDMQHHFYYGVTGASVSEDGSIIGTFTIQPDEFNYDFDPAITFRDSEFLVVWHRNDLLVGRFLDRSGGNRDSIFTVTSVASTNNPEPAVAAGAEFYLVTWQDFRSLPARIYGARVSSFGDTPDSSGIPISDSAAGPTLPVVSYDGHNYLVVWQDYHSSQGSIRGRRVSEDGQLLDSTSVVITSAGWPGTKINECCAHGAGNYLVLWQDARNGMYQIYGARVDANRVVLDTVGLWMRRFSPTFWADSVATVASDGQDCFVVWPRTTNPPAILGTRVGRLGSIRDSEKVTIPTLSYTQVHTAATYADTTYLVVWVDLENISEARVSRSCRLLDSSGIRVASGSCFTPAVASDGTNFLVVWDEMRGNPLDHDICATRIAESGALLDTPYVVVSGAAYSQREPSVAFGAECYLVTWRDSRSGSSQVYCARVSRSGQVLDTAGTAVSLLNYETAPSVAFDGTNFLVVWQNKPSGQWASVLGARVNQDGVLMDTTALVVMPAATYFDELRPRVIFDGRNYVVAWTCSGSSISDAYGRRVTPSGDLLDTFCIGSGTGDQISPSLAANSQDEVLIVYSGITDSLYQYPLNTMRIWARAGTLEGLQEPSSRANVLYPLLAAPNPFRTAVSFRATPLRPVRLRISDVSGRTVRRIEARSSEVVWNGNDQNGMNLPPGVYFVQQETARNTDCLKVIKLDR